MNKKYAICYNTSIENVTEASLKLQNILNRHNLAFEVLNINNLKPNFDFVFVIGGDGTILKASRFYSKYQTPIFGVNLGHLGFLSQANLNDVDYVIKKIINKDYKIEERIMLECDNYTALNDFVIKGEENSRATNFALEINGKFVSEYFADGIIISTPTGSTAYGMASGGPVLTPDTQAIAIVPICPHTFAARPLVISSESTIKIISKPEFKYCVSADGQEVFSFENELKITKSKYNANLVLLNDNDFYSVLRNKLHWGFTPYKKV